MKRWSAVAVVVMTMLPVCALTSSRDAQALHRAQIALMMKELQTLRDVQRPHVAQVAQSAQSAQVRPPGERAAIYEKPGSAPPTTNTPAPSDSWTKVRGPGSRRYPMIAVAWVEGLLVLAAVVVFLAGRRRLRGRPSAD